MSNPNLGLLLFVVPRLPNTLNDAVYNLFDIPTFHPNVLHARFVVTGDDRLLHHYRRRRDHYGSWSYDNRSGGYHRRLSDNHSRGARGIVYGVGQKPCAEKTGADGIGFAVMVVVMVMMRMRRGTVRPLRSARSRKRTD